MNKNYNYQDIKYFNKNGYEIPCAIASNIVVKIYKKNNIKDATILNGVYMNELSEDGQYYLVKEFKLLDSGKSFDSSVISNEDIAIDVYVDGKLIEDYIINKCEILSTNSYSVSYTSSNAYLDEYVLYGINEIELNIAIPIKYNLIFPSVVFESNIELETVSTELHSVETLYFGVINNNKLLKPYFTDYNLLFLTDVKDNDIQFFVADKITNEIYKRHKVEIDLSDEDTTDDDYMDMTSIDYQEDIFEDYIKTKTPQVNICFSSKEEGVHEQKIYVLLQNRNNIEDTIKIGEINVTVECIGEDERFRTLFANFGIPDPALYPTLFKSADIKEDKIDWELVNMKSKELFLSYDEIFPYVGTYKALINAVKFLGFDDVYFREWYKDIKNKITFSKRLNINENFNDYNDLVIDNILDNTFSTKKLNKLTLVYKLNEESGEYDEYDNPIIKNVYAYSVDEVLLKIESLKKWLERNIIALNCRIIEITGEGVVYEKQAYKVYPSIMQNLEYEDIIEFEPIVKNKIEKLVDGSANIKVSILNNTETSAITFNDLNDFLGSTEGTIEYPFSNNLHIKAYVECDTAKIVGNIKNNNYLFINKGEIYNSSEDNLITKDCCVEFEKAPSIYLRKANIRKDSNNIVSYREWWNNNIEFEINNTSEENYSYSIKNKNNEIEYKSNDYIILRPIDEKSILSYSTNNKMNIPLFTFRNYQVCLYNNNKLTYNKLFNEDKDYYLEIIDGRIINEESDTKTSYLIFSYDENNEQSIKVNYKYEGTQMIDYDVVVENGVEKYKYYNEYFNINVNNIGHYRIMAYAINDYGNIFAKEILSGCDVINTIPEIGIYTKYSVIANDKNFYFEDSIQKDKETLLCDDVYPYFNWKHNIYDLNFKKENSEISYSNISYIYDTAKRGDYLEISNLYDRLFIENVYKDSITVHTQMKNSNYYNIGDRVQMVFYNNLCLNGVYEIEGYITNIEIIDNESIYNISTNVNEIQKYIDNIHLYNLYMFNITEYNVIDAIIEDDVTKIYIDKNSNSYKKGDVVKFIYNINDLTDYVYARLNDDNIENVYCMIGDEIVAVRYDDNIENLTSTFSGYSTFRIKDVDNKNGIITIDGKFLYKKYIDGIYYKKHNDKTLYPLEFENDEIIKTLTGLLDIKINIILTRANQNYVNYIMKAIEDSVEYENQEVIIKTSKNRLYDYIDNTYTLVPMNFNKLNAFNYWSFEDKYTNYYLHKKPITINKTDKIIITNKSEELQNSNIVWKLYRQNLFNKTRELLFEVKNKVVPICIKDEGIYDIEMTLYDNYGNIFKVDKQAHIKVK